MVSEMLHVAVFLARVVPLKSIPAVFGHHHSCKSVSLRNDITTYGAFLAESPDIPLLCISGEFVGLLLDSWIVLFSKPASSLTIKLLSPSGFAGNAYPRQSRFLSSDLAQNARWTYSSREMK